VGIALASLLTGAPPRPAALFSPPRAIDAPQLILPPHLRSEPGRIAYAIDPAQEAVVMAWPAGIPDEAPPDQVFRFEIGAPGKAADWSYEMSAAQVRHHLDVAEVVTLLVPAAVLGPGTHEARLLASSGGAPLYLAYVDVSPAGAPR